MDNSTIGAWSSCVNIGAAQNPFSCHVVYRGQDGNMDYDNNVAVMALGDSDVTINDQDLPEGTSWHFVRRQVSDCGLESTDSDICRVVIDSEGDMIAAAPNAPVDLVAESLAGAVVRLRWRYSQLFEEVAPTGFRIYIDSGSGFDFSTPDATVEYGLGGSEYEWTSGALDDGAAYKFCVRSYREELGPDLVINGTFENDKYWTWLRPGWDLFSNQARFVAAGGVTYGNLDQDIAVGFGKTYRITYTVASISGCDVNPRIGGKYGIQRWIADTYTEDITAVNTSGLRIYVDSQNQGDYAVVDNISTKEVLAADTESSNNSFVSATADSLGPPAITGILAWSEDA